MQKADPDLPENPVYTRKDLEDAVVEVGWDYFLKAEKLQYCSMEITDGLNKYYGGTYRLTERAAPEYGTDHTTIYSVCSGFVHKVYYEALGYCIFDSYDYLDAVSNAYLQFGEEIALLSWVSNSYTPGANERVLKAANIQTNLEQTYAFLSNWEENLRPGDVLFPEGHVMLYVGNGKIIDCWGSKYNTTTGLELFEANGAVHTVYGIEDLLITGTDPARGDRLQIKENGKIRHFTIYRPLNTFVTEDGDNDPANDVVTDRNFVLPADTMSRLQYPCMEINRTVDATPYGTVATGENLTYRVQISNLSNDPDIIAFKQLSDPSYSGVSYANLVVTEKIPEGTQLVAGSISDNGVYSNGVITWTLDLQKGEKADLRYSVKVTAPMGSTIVSEGGTVADIASNSISNVVGGKNLSETALAGLTTLAQTDKSQWREQYNISKLGTDLEFAERVYGKAMNIGLELPTVQEIVSNLFTFDTVTVPSKSLRYDGSGSAQLFTRKENVSAEYQQIADMMVDRYTGGSKMYFADQTRTIYEFRFDYLKPGDVLIYADTNALGSVTDTQVIVFAGNNTLLIMNSDNECYVYTGKENSNMDLAFTKLWEAYIRDIFFLLRPSQAIADINQQPYDSTNEPVYGEEPADGGEGAQWGGTTLNAENLNKLAGLNQRFPGTERLSANTNQSTTPFTV